MRYQSAADAAARLGLSEQLVRRMARDGRLARHAGRRVLIPESDD